EGMEQEPDKPCARGPVEMSACRGVKKAHHPFSYACIVLRLRQRFDGGVDFRVRQRFAAPGAVQCSYESVAEFGMALQAHHWRIRVFQHGVFGVAGARKGCGAGWRDDHLVLMAYRE